MNWSQLKKRITERLAESVRDRIDFGITNYRKSHDQMGRGWITIDKNEIIDMPTVIYYLECSHIYHTQRLNHHEAGKILNEQNLFSQEDLSNSLYEYLNLSFEEILKSKNPLIRAFGMLDSRLGRRRLQRLDMSNEHELVKRFWQLRLEVEGIMPDGSNGIQCLSTSIKNPYTRLKKRNGEAERSAVAKLNSSKKTRNIQTLIVRIYQQEIDKEELDTELSKIIYSGFENVPDRSKIYHYLLHIHSNSKLLKTVKHAKGVIQMAKDSDYWLRPYNTWKPKSHNPDQQFSSLARHLWAQYDVPTFMDQAWFEENPDYQNWFRHIGLGGNIRTTTNLPFPMTKMMAHHFIQAPPTYSIEAALRWAQVHALGGDARLADALQETRLVRDFSNNEFWLSVLRFFIKNPMLDPAQINPIVDYIWNQRFQNRIIFVEQGVAQEIGPAQPNLTMKGRTVESLLKAVATWHQQLGKESKGGELQWKRSGIESFQWIEGTERYKNMRVWRIRELLSSKELIAEGRQMKHCVATYAQSCYKGFCSI